MSLCINDGRIISYEIREKISGISEEMSGLSPEWKIMNSSGYPPVVLKLRSSDLDEETQARLIRISVGVFEWDSTLSEFVRIMDLKSSEIDAAKSYNGG